MNHKLRKENRIMKKYILSAIAVAGMFAMTSCEDFLKPEKEGEYSNSSYFFTDQQAIDAVDACYYPFYDEGGFGREFMWEQGGANDFVWGRTRGYPQMATLSQTSSTGPQDSFWENCTRGLQRSNYLVEALLNKQKGKELTAIEKRSLGEAYFMRAFSHFYIAYRYGTNKQGVPFVRFEDFPSGYDFSIPTQQPTVMDNYKMIVEDLDKAEALLPHPDEYSDNDFGRASKVACAGYKAKVYAYWACWDKSQYANVITEVTKMMTQYGRDLAPDFTDNFTSDWSKWRNKEYVYSIPSEGGGKGQYGGVEFPGVILDNGAWGYMNGWGQFKPSLDIFKEMQKDTKNLVAGTNNDDDNYRLRKSILEYGQKFVFFGDKMRFYSTRDVESGFMIAKYLEPFSHEDPIETGYVSNNGDWPVCRMNFPLLRFADCLLLRAEAYLATGNASAAKADIDKVRARVGIKPLEGNATWTDLYHERRCELAFEHSDHLYDLKRWAVGGEAEIKALAITELEKHPDARHYTNEEGEMNGNIQDVNYDGEKLYWEKDPDQYPESENKKITSVTQWPVMVAARACWAAPYVEGPYLDYQEPAKKWEDWKIVFPYRDSEVQKSNGALKQNENY